MASRSLFKNRFKEVAMSRGMIWGGLIIAALLAFEIFNYSTTEFAMFDLLGELRFIGIRWSTILAIAFCGIDFAGIARLFTPEQGADEPMEVWYLFGAWLLAAAMNAMLTWWGISIAIVNHQSLGNEVVARETLIKVVPIFVAVMVWLIRVLIIGTFSIAGDRLFSQADQPARARSSSRSTSTKRKSTSTARPSYNRSRQQNSVQAQGSYRPAPKSNRPEPTYHPVSASANRNGQNSSRNNYNRNNSGHDPMG